MLPKRRCAFLAAQTICPTSLLSIIVAKSGGSIIQGSAILKRMAVLVLLLAAVVFAPHQAADAATCHPVLQKVGLSPASVPGGAPAVATVTVSCDTPAALTVRLKGFKGVTTPAALHVARGKKAATGTIKTSVTTTARHGKIAATLGKTVRKAPLAITRTPRSCKTPVLTGFSAPALVYVGGSPVATVRLSCAPTSPIRISLASSNADLRIPASVTIGRFYDTATVPLTPKADPEGQYTSTLTARFGSTSRTAPVTVDPGLSLFEIPPASEPNTVTPDVLFTGVIPAGGLTVQLASDNPAVTVPATFTFPAGSLGGEFPGVTVQSVTKNTTVKLSATFGGRTLSATTVLIPPFDSSDSLTLSNENGPGAIYGQEFDLEYVVLLSNPAPASGETVIFSTPSPSLELESTSGFISPGFVDGFVDIDTANVTSAVHTEIKATVDGVKASLPVTIEPGLASITNVPATITGGDSFTATVNLAGPVDVATTVGLQSDSGILTAPSDVVIPAGQSSANFSVTTVPVDSDSDGSITASLGSNRIFSSTVTLTP
jgi:hypothetical protein